jgi:hypothetical protein
VRAIYVAGTVGPKVGVKSFLAEQIPDRGLARPALVRPADNLDVGTTHLEVSLDDEIGEVEQ